MREYIRLVEAAQNGCPPATQDFDLNLENRNKAIKEYYYGPANPEKPGDFWQHITKLWEIPEEEAKTMRCANCAAFDVSDEMRDCISAGIRGGKPEIDAMATVQVGDVGYCNFHKFKCAGKRTCRAWVHGGPIDDEDLTK